MALVGLMLATKKASRVEYGGIEVILHPARRHEVEEARDVISPRQTVLFISLEKLRAGREQRDVLVLDTEDGRQEIFEVVALGEARDLAGVVESNVQHAADAGRAKGFKEPLGRFRREADGADDDGGIVHKNMKKVRPVAGR